MDLRSHPVPRCPTCRSGVRVDFDSSSRRLVFSTADGASSQRTNERILNQVQPTLKDMLREYGEDFPARGPSAVDLNRTASWVHRRVEAGQAALTCVCGEIMQRITTDERNAAAGKGHSSLICDVCDGRMRGSDIVWSCRNRDSTLMHSGGLDICDCCVDSCVRGQRQS